MLLTASLECDEEVCQNGDGNFDICHTCYELGKSCSDRSHRLKQYLTYDLVDGSVGNPYGEPGIVCDVCKASVVEEFYRTYFPSLYYCVIGKLTRARLRHLPRREFRHVSELLPDGLGLPGLQPCLVQIKGSSLNRLSIWFQHLPIWLRMRVQLLRKKSRRQQHWPSPSPRPPAFDGLHNSPRTSSRRSDTHSHPPGYPPAPRSGSSATSCPARPCCCANSTTPGSGLSPPCACGRGGRGSDPGAKTFPFSDYPRSCRAREAGPGPGPGTCRCCCC